LNYYEEVDKIVDMNALDQTTDGLELYSYFYERLFFYLYLKDVAITFNNLAEKQYNFIKVK